MLLVLPPKLPRRSSVEVLSLLTAAAKQNDEHIAIFARIDAVAWSKLHTQLQNAFTNTLCGQVAMPETVNGRRNP